MKYRNPMKLNKSFFASAASIVRFRNPKEINAAHVHTEHMLQPNEVFTITENGSNIQYIKNANGSIRKWKEFPESYEQPVFFGIA